MEQRKNPTAILQARELASVEEALLPLVEVPAPTMVKWSINIWPHSSPAATV